MKGVVGGRAGSWRVRIRGVEVGGGGARNRCVLNHNAPVPVPKKCVMIHNAPLLPPTPPSAIGGVVCHL